MTNTTVKSGDLRIEALRGFAILAVVLHHASLWISQELAGSPIQNSMPVELSRFLSELLGPLRMPLFTVLSGWVYALRPFSLDSSREFMSGKFRRILLPLFFVSSIMYFLYLLVTDVQPGIVGPNARPVETGEFWVLWFFHFGHLWFLQALLVIFGCMAVIDTLGWMRTVKQWLGWMALAALAFYFNPYGIEFWSLSRVVTILVFFIFGVGVYRFRDQIFTRRIIIASFIGFSAMICLNYYLQSSEIGNFRVYWPLKVIAGTLGPIAILSMKLTWAPFVWLGSYSYSIYLYHGAVYLLVSPWISRFLHNELMHWLWLGIAVSAALFTPILLEKIGERIPMLRTPLLGRKP